jgi:hypothetical protein
MSELVDQKAEHTPPRKYVILRTGGDEIQPKGLWHAPRN